MKIAAAVAVLSIWVVPVVASPVATPSAVNPASAKPVVAPKPLEVTDIIDREGQFIFSDTSSYFIFKKDGTFKSFPLSLSGRTIEGTWVGDGFMFEIQGAWGWINGLSPLDDRRKMTLCIVPRATFKTNEKLPWLEEDKSAKVYDCYFEIEELVKIPKAPGGKPSPK